MRFVIRAVLIGLGLGLAGQANSETRSERVSNRTDVNPSGLLMARLAEGPLSDRLKSIPQLYKSTDNTYLQELTILGMLQVQYARGDSNGGTYGSSDFPEDLRWGGNEVRRFRLGMKATLFKHLKFFSLIDIYPNFSPEFYRGIPEMDLIYTFNDTLNIALGKAEVKFTHEMAPSSIDVLPFERSQLVNQFYAGELTGAWVHGKGIAGGWLYHFGVYSNDLAEDFSEFDGGAVVLAKIGYDYSKQSCFEAAQVEFYYQYNSEPGYVGTKGVSPLYSNGFSIANQFTEGKFRLDVECFWSEGFGQRTNAGGFSVMPTYYLMDKLQLVTTIQVALNDGDNGIALPTRYERQVFEGKERNGDTYFAGYLGFNYYIDGNRLKILTGVKFSTMSGGEKDFTGCTWLVGVRTYF